MANRVDEDFDRVRLVELIDSASEAILRAALGAALVHIPTPAFNKACAQFGLSSALGTDVYAILEDLIHAATESEDDDEETSEGQDRGRLQ